MKERSQRALALFLGHGSPMNALEINEFSSNWRKCSHLFSKPKAILVISAHWYTPQTRMNQEAQPKLIYDMYGFPKELYTVKYPVNNALDVVTQVQVLLGKQVIVDNDWGFDHGTWSVLVHLYPEADIPIVQLSIDYQLPAQAHFELGQKLAILREQGIMILGSGNIVHNLALVNRGMAKGYSWADAFDQYITEAIQAKNDQDVIFCHRAGEAVKKAFYTLEHYYPLLYVLGARHAEDQVTIFNAKRIMGSISMTSYLFK